MTPSTPLEHTENKERPPTYDVGYWEYVYELELKRYMAILEEKARRLKYLKEIDLFAISEQKAVSITKQIHYLEKELNAFYGMKLFMDEMKNCYLDSSCKIHDMYANKNLQLEVFNQKLKDKLIELHRYMICKESRTSF